MATANKTQRPCNICAKDSSTVTCDGCHLSFCIRHQSEHRQELNQQIDNIEKQNYTLKLDLTRRGIDMSLLTQIEQWERESIAKIQVTAKKARTDLKRLTEESRKRLISLMDKLSNELARSRIDNSFTENDISQWMRRLEELREDLNTPSGIELIQEDESSSLRLIMTNSYDKTRDNKTNISSENIFHSEERPSKVVVPGTSSQDGQATTDKPELSSKIGTSSSSQSFSYPSMTFGLDVARHQDIQHLFKRLMLLDPMDKNGPMHGKCNNQTEQMERFLSQTFGFKNIAGQHIVQGVRSFQIDRSPRSMDPRKTIYFPSNTDNLFAMTVQEIIDWQRSYVVYADKNVKNINKEFLYRALQGQSRDGEEAFRMKFVVRISTCPILMEFDAKIIPRKLNEDWPHRIKLVSVTGIDFAGRKHDVNDILYYVSNWKDIFEIDPRTNGPALANERDFHLKKNRRRGELHEGRLLNDLTCMARLRLRACDEEGVQIVLETGIGLGVFSGEHIEVDEKVRITSAIAIRRVLEEDGSSYKNIRAIVFALPRFNKSRSNQLVYDTFDYFVHEFQEPQYNGHIPVLIADQDMHRLTVAIARQGFTVSELNPADSHGVFGEYWQNRGPAVEEKLALTTVGLLVQHHLINPHVLDLNKYNLI